MAARFNMHGQYRAARVNKRRQQRIRFFDHQVDIERQVGNRVQGLHHRRTNGQVRHKAAVHHIHVQQRSPRRLDAGDFIGQTRKISREN